MTCHVVDLELVHNIKHWEGRSFGGAAANLALDHVFRNLHQLICFDLLLGRLLVLMFFVFDNFEISLPSLVKSTDLLTYILT